MDKEDGISLKSISHPSEPFGIRSLFNYIHLNYFYDVSEKVLETIEIEVKDDIL